MLNMIILNKKLICFMLFFFTFSSFNVNAQKNFEFTNKLINETSPYLLQHAHNPVEWYPWGDEALEKARKENKLLLISIGYSACHWCHVMEHESFQNKKVAAYMNANFVCIKVDREERPDVDMVYMSAVQLLTGRGGWPLNCIAMPNGKPLYGGTYFSKYNWMKMLRWTYNFAKNKPKEAKEQSDNLTLGIANHEFVGVDYREKKIDKAELDIIFNNWKKNIDFQRGGKLKPPKFPMPSSCQFMMHYDSDDAQKALSVKLKAMSRGGIYDQLGGGFSRYSTDKDWLIPHFEKMLYDNAQLISVYSKAYQKTKNIEYKHVVQESINFIDRELTSDCGAFFSSIDADSEYVEGAFYIWTMAEIEKILSPNAAKFIRYFNVTKKGNWEGGENILYVDLHKTLPDENSDLYKYISKCKVKLLSHRAKRIRPATDDKILCSWNALMLKAYVDAYNALGDERYLNKALLNADFIIENFIYDNNKLKRNYKNGKSNIDGFLDDYAFTIDAFITIYENNFDMKYLSKALELTENTIANFYSEKNHMFYYSSNLTSSLITRKMEIFDNVIPSSNSQMAINLFKLSQYYEKPDYLLKSKQMFNNVKDQCLTGGVFYANWDILLSYFVHEIFNIAIIGDNCLALRKEFNKYYLPYVFFSGDKHKETLSIHEGQYVKKKTLIYVCKDRTCDYPVDNVTEAILKINIKK